MTGDSAVVNWIQEHSPVVAFDGYKCRLEWWIREEHYKAEGTNLREAVKNAMGYEPDPPPAQSSIEPDGVEAIREWFGGEGDLLTEEQIESAWQEFSTDYCASWLIVSRSTLGNFAGWLLGKRVDESPGEMTK